jgi:hypothetical protein
MPSPSVDPAVHAFRALADGYIRGRSAAFPQWASAMGLDEYDARLGANHGAFHREYAGFVRDCLDSLERIPASALGAGDRLDRRGLLSHLRAEALAREELRRWENNPQVHCDAAIHSLFDLAVRHADHMEPVVPALLARLAEIPRFLAEGAACLRRPVPLWTRLAGRTCAGAPAFLAGLERQLLPLVRDRDGLTRKVAAAADAFARYRAAAERASPGGKDGFAIGRDHFEFLVRERTGLNLSARELVAEGEHLVGEIGQALEREARKHGAGSAAHRIEALRAAWTPGNRPLIDLYRETTERLRARLVAADLAGIPRGERLRVLPVPEFLRHHFPTAAYTAPPPWSRRQEGVFWVNDLSLGAGNAERRLAEQQQHFGLGLTCAHEGYPGHHLQFAVQNRHPSRLRRMFAHAIAYEGWTLWCERLCADRGLVPGKHTRLLQLHDSLWRAHRIVIDCGLQTGSLSFRGACRRLEAGVRFTRARAEADVHWYTAAPTVPLSYLMGRLEVEKLHRQLVTQSGWGLRKFHDWLLGFGAIPFAWIREEGCVPG